MANKKARKSTSRSLAKGRASSQPLTVLARLLGDIRSLIDRAREQTARAVNSAIVMLYWQIGTRVREDVLHEERAEYGEQIVSTLSTQLTTEYGRGFGRRNLFRMIRFTEVFPDGEIVQTLSAALGWSHFADPAGCRVLCHPRDGAQACGPTWLDQLGGM